MRQLDLQAPALDTAVLNEAIRRSLIRTLAAIGSRMFEEARMAIAAARLRALARISR